MHTLRNNLFILCLTFITLLTPFFVSAEQIDPLIFDDKPLDEPLVSPEWFKLSFLEIAEDIKEAKLQNKKGLIIYFGQKYCPYCKAHMKNNWGQDDIKKYTQQNFDVIAINVKGQRPVTDIDGKAYTEKSFSALKKTNFTPSIIFYNVEGKEILRLRGYRPPYQFRAALEYVADAHYKKETFKNYMARAEAAMSYGSLELNQNSLFNKPPHLLARNHIAAEQPLMVVFERKHCHACDILHAGPFIRNEIETELLKLEVIQLDVNSEQRLITPAGQKLMTKQWAEKLGINYSPTIIFFDEKGKEIIRIESVVWFYRLRNVLKYVLSGAYKKYSTFQLWRQAENMR
ncbi:MAG: thioredoxin fold domain-containing protein [Woeseiaceae bacterium]